MRCADQLRAWMRALLASARQLHKLKMRALVFYDMAFNNARLSQLTEQHSKGEGLSASACSLLSFDENV